MNNDVGIESVEMSKVLVIYTGGTVNTLTLTMYNVKLIDSI